MIFEGLLVSAVCSLFVANVFTIPEEFGISSDDETSKFNLQRLNESSTEDPTYFTFPDEFLLGAATSAYQTEGAWNVDGKGPSIQDVFYHMRPNYTNDSTNADNTSLSYYKYQEDIKALKIMGLQHYRFSISWPRIMPTGLINYINQKGIDHYNKIIDLLIENKITPVVQMYHWDLPQHLQNIGGWTNEVLVQYFEDYARVLLDNFGDRVKWWSTINEPYFVALGYDEGNSSPGINFTGIGPYLASRVMLKAHAKVYHLYDTVYRSKQSGKISITLCAQWAKPKDDNSSEDKEAARRMIEFYLGWFAQPIYSKEGDYPKLMKDRIRELSLKQGFKKSRMPEFTKEEISYIRGTSDYFSLNEYAASIVTPGKCGESPSYLNDRAVIETVPKWPKSPTSSWETIAPMSIRDVLNWVKNSYDRADLEFLITENGYADEGELNDQRRIDYLATYMIEVLKALYVDGCKVIGYTVWTLIDGFEWKPGHTAKFGLIYVNFSDPERPRTPKQSSLFMKDVVERRKIPSKYYKVDEKLDKLENL